MKVKCLLVDDEPLAIKLIQNHMEQLDSFEVVGTSGNAVKAFEILRTTPVDLLFLDIKMPQITGIEFLKTLHNPPAVIITTAYREYALEGYDLDIVDYLLKPITFERFFKAIERYLRKSNPVPPVSATVTQQQPPQDQFIYLRSGSKFHKLDIDDILYFESQKDYIVAHCNSNKITAKYKISELEAELKGKHFLRVHRSFIINLQKVTAFTPYDVEIGAGEVPIGASYKEYVLKSLRQVNR
jgi:two-component system LytT family response regulator